MKRRERELLELRERERVCWDTRFLLLVLVLVIEICIRRAGTHRVPPYRGLAAL